MSECKCGEELKEAYGELYDDVVGLASKYQDKMNPGQFSHVLMDAAVDITCDCAKDIHQGYGVLLQSLANIVFRKMNAQEDDEEVDQ